MKDASSNRSWVGTIALRDEHGKPAELHYRLPRPDRTSEERPSRLLEVPGLAGLRRRVEGHLDHGCGPSSQDLRELGPGVAIILCRLARAEACGCKVHLRLAAIGALGSFPTAEAADLLIDLAGERSGDPGVRCAAIGSLGAIGSPSAVATLSTLARKERVVFIRLAAVKALELTSDLKAVEVLRLVAEKDREASVRQRAQVALGVFERVLGIHLGAEHVIAVRSRGAPRAVPAPKVATKRRSS